MAFRSASFASGSTTSIAGSAPAGATSGDRVVALVSMDSSSRTITAPTGWSTAVIVDQASPDSGTFAISEKVLAGGDSYTFTADSGFEWTLQILCFSGRHASTASTVGASSQSTASNATPVSVTFNGVTAASGDDLVVALGLDITGSGGTWSMSTPPTGFTQRRNDTNGFACGIMASQDGVSAGATGTLNATVTRTAGSGNTGWTGWLIAIPAGAAADTLMGQACL